MLQATVGDSLSFDPLSLDQDGGAASEVDVGWGEIVDALVVTAVVVGGGQPGGVGLGVRPAGGGFQTEGVFLRPGARVDLCFGVVVDGGPRGTVCVAVAR